MTYDLRADLDEFLLESRHRPVFDQLRRRQRAQEIAEIVSERMKLETDGVGGKRPTRQTPIVATTRREHVGHFFRCGHRRAAPLGCGLQKKFRAGEPEVTGDTAAFLVSWLTNRVPNIDKLYGQLLNEKGVA
jgi:hypothetical protein